MKNEKLTEMNNQSLQDRLLEYKKKYFNLRFQKSSGQLDNTSRVSKVRKLIARIKTIKNEKVKEN